MSKGFRIDGHFIPISYDTNNDGKLTVQEVSIWCKYNDFKYDSKTKKILPAPGEYLEDDIKNLNFDNKKYSLESLKKRYPANKYDIEYDESSGKRIFVRDKSTNRLILRVDNNFCLNGQKEIKMYDEFEEVCTLIYDKTGMLISYETKTEKGCPIADNINKAVSAKNKLFFPTTNKKDLIKYVKLLTPVNIMELDYYYERHYGESLEDTIKNEIGLDNDIKKTLLEHLNKCFEEAVGCNTEYENSNSQIANKYYTGDKFSITRKNGKLTIVNLNSKENYYIDLDILLQDFPLREKAILKKHITKLPGEVLADLATELDADDLNFGGKNKDDKEIATGGFYRPILNTITLNWDKGYINTLVHELGHAVDFMPYISQINLSSINKNSEFNSTFEKEMSNYINCGYRKYGKSSIEYMRKNGKNGKNSNYATASKSEMFAECYALLMTGSCNSQDVIEDFFPETLKIIKTHIANIHKMDKNQRN